MVTIHIALQTGQTTRSSSLFIQFLETWLWGHP